MRNTIIRFSPKRCFGIVAGAALLTAMNGHALPALTAQSAPTTAGVPDLSGVWDGTRRAHPINSATVPWARTVGEGTLLPDGTPAGKNYVSNFPELNERALAFQKIFDEPLSPKYDCQPSTPPALEFDPFNMEVVQWPDRVLLRYEKDDQTPNGLARRAAAHVPRLWDSRILGRPLRIERTPGGNHQLRLRHHRIRRLQRDSIVPAEESDGALLARR